MHNSIFWTPSFMLFLNFGLIYSQYLTRKHCVLNLLKGRFIKKKSIPTLESLIEVNTKTHSVVGKKTMDHINAKPQP